MDPLPPASLSEQGENDFQKWGNSFFRKLGKYYLLFTPVFQILASQGKQPFFIPLDESLVPSSEQVDNLTAIEDIIMVGYPDGI